jgi:hypothetical protein
MIRRNAIKSMIALAVAPAILKVEMIMPVKAIVPVSGYLNYYSITEIIKEKYVPGMAENIYDSSNLLKILQDKMNEEKSNYIRTII